MMTSRTLLMLILAALLGFPALASAGAKRGVRTEPARRVVPKVDRRQKDPKTKGRLDKRVPKRPSAKADVQRQRYKPDEKVKAERKTRDIDHERIQHAPPKPVIEPRPADGKARNASKARRPKKADRKRRPLKKKR